jgi:hypothetical protein
MELWTEYEGTTIDGAFPLTKLLRPEGRSAFFTTTNGSGVPRFIRLIESHFDDDEIIARWRGVAALNHPHLVKLEKYGVVELDETSLVYAVMEPVDANLGDVLSGQRLTLPEARQLTASLMDALEALHSHGFVHEHVEPASLLAVGEEVKLRSDCIRETPEGREGIELKKRDVRDASIVVLQALTQQRTLEAASRDLPLPAPFDQIVPKGISGEWGIAEISALIKPPAAPAARPITRVEPLAAAASPLSAEVKSTAPAKPMPAIGEAKGTPAAKTTRATPPSSEPLLPFSDPLPAGVIDVGSGPIPRSAMLRPALLLAAGLVVLLVLFFGWRSMRHSTSPQSAAPIAALASDPASTLPPVTPRAAKTSAAHPAAGQGIAAAVGAQPARTGSASGGHGQWRVIAFTYNHEDQAQHKAETIAQKHPELQPAVFTPSGHAPYLVALGGAMSRDEAFAYVRKVRSAGLPRDSYAQNYNSAGR